jgi:hypothetical protein
MTLLKAIGKTDIRGDRTGVVGCRVEKAAWPKKAGKVKCNYDVLRGSPPNLIISLRAEIEGTAGIGGSIRTSLPQAYIPSWVDSLQYQTQAKAPVTFRFS